MADMVQNKQTKIKRVLVGRVVSNKMDKTIVVKTERVYSHPLLKKTVRSFKPRGTSYRALQMLKETGESGKGRTSTSRRCR